MSFLPEMMEAGFHLGDDMIDNVLRIAHEAPVENSKW